MKNLILFILFFMVGVTITADNFYTDYKPTDKKLLEGIDFYESIQFDDAEKIFLSIVETTENRMDKALCYKYLGFIYSLKQDQKKTEGYYEKLFDIYPDYTIETSKVSPKISQFYEDYQEMWLRMPSSKIRIYPIAMENVVYKSGVSLPVEWHDPNVEVGYVIVNYKSEKELSYSTAKFQDIKTKNFTAYFPVSFLNDPEEEFNLHYYIEVFNTEGEKAVTLGNVKEPKSIKVKLDQMVIEQIIQKKKDEEARKPKWYTSWWFITAVSVVVVGTAGGIYYNSTLEPTKETPNGANLNIYISE